MNHFSDKAEYISIARSVPVAVNLTNMRISKLFFYNQFIKKKINEKTNINDAI